MASPSNCMKLVARTTMVATRRSLSAAAPKAKVEPESKTLKPKAKESQSFVMNLFRGQLAATSVFPFPDVLNDEQHEMLSMIVGPTEKFFEEVNNPYEQDEKGEIPKDVLQRFADLGAFGCVVPPEYEGAGMNNTQMARLAEIVGQYDLSLGVCMGAHQSIGYKGIVLFGTEAQKKKYLPDLATGRKFASFALTEPGSGSDANSIKSRAEKSADGKHYVLNGSKVWITNSGFAEVFTVFAKTPVKTKTGETKDKVSAFIVERGFGGLTTGPPEKKMGIKSSNTCEVYFENVKIPVENLLGEEGEGFKVAMNILNNGRFGIPASMTGVIRHCLAKSTDFAVNRTQFGKKLMEFKDIKEKIADMAIKHYVSESIVYMLAGTMDKGVQDYQLEAAIGKVITSEYAWHACDEAIQIHGGMGFMKEPGLERVLRDLRIFRIFEGANDILRLFVSLTGLQYSGGHLRELAKAMKSPTSNFGALFEFAGKRVSRSVGLSGGPSFNEHVHNDLVQAASLTSKCVAEFGATAEQMLIKSGKGIIDEQNQLRRLGDAAIEIYSQVCILSRCTRSLKLDLPSAKTERLMTDTFVRQSSERALLSLSHIKSVPHNTDWANMGKIADEIFEHGEVVVQHPLGV